MPGPPVSSSRPMRQARSHWSPEVWRPRHLLHLSHQEGQRGPDRLGALLDRKDAPLTVFQAIILGLTQGITEFAPVSSSGHLILVPWLFGWTIVNDPALNKTFDVALHMGTLLGALIYFRSDVALYLGAWIRSIRKRSVETADERIAWLLILGTIPGAIAGALFESMIEDKLGQPWLIAVFLVVGGVVLYFVDTRVRSDRV